MDPKSVPGKATSSLNKKGKSRARIASGDEEYVPTSPKRTYRRPADPSYRPGRTPSPTSPQSPLPSKKAKNKYPQNQEKSPATGFRSRYNSRHLESSPSGSQSQKPEESSTMQVRPSSLKQKSASLRTIEKLPEKRVSFDQSTTQAHGRGSRPGAPASTGVKRSRSETENDEGDEGERRVRRITQVGDSDNAILDILWDFDLSDRQAALVGHNQASQLVRGSGAEDALNIAGMLSGIYCLHSPHMFSLEKGSTEDVAKKLRGSGKSSQYIYRFDEREKSRLSRNPSTTLSKMLEEPEIVFSLEVLTSCFKHIQKRCHAWASNHFSYRVHDDQAAKIWTQDLLNTKYRPLLTLIEHITKSSNGYGRWYPLFTAPESRVALVYSIVGFYALHWVFNSIDHDVLTTTASTSFDFFNHVEEEAIKPDEVDDSATNVAETILTIIAPLLPPFIFEHETSSSGSSSNSNMTWGDPFAIRQRQIIKRQLSVILRNCVALNWAMRSHIQEQRARHGVGLGTTAIRTTDQVRKGTTGLIDRYRIPGVVDQSGSGQMLQVKMTCWPGVEARIISTVKQRKNDKHDGHPGKDSDGDIDMLNDVYDPRDLRTTKEHNVTYKALCEQHVYCELAQENNDSNNKDDDDSDSDSDNGNDKDKDKESDHASDKESGGQDLPLLRRRKSVKAKRRGLKDRVLEGRGRIERKANAGAWYRRLTARGNLNKHLERHKWKYHAAAMLLGFGSSWVFRYKQDRGLNWKQLFEDGVGKIAAHWSEQFKGRKKLARQDMHRLFQFLSRLTSEE